MSTVQRQIWMSIGFSITIYLVSLSSVFYVFPLEKWSDIWEREIFGVPFLLFTFFISIIIGVIVGVSLGYYWKNFLKQVEDSLHQIEQGGQANLPNYTATEEIQAIWSRVEKIQKYINEQAKHFQKLTNEKAEDQEKRIQEMISQERNRLARELHDSVSQQLFAASMLMSAINETKPVTNEREGKQLKMVEQMIHQSQLEMRALLLHLRPVALKGKSLKEGIDELLLELTQRIPLTIHWKVESLPLDKGVEDHLFRILQESVSNTLRHAKATTLEVLLVQRGELIILRIEDDGVGFDVDGEGKAGSYGLQNMYERAVEIGAVMRIVSVKNKGTRLEVKVPR